MINVDISNIWTCVSLPQLLESEQLVFEGHNSLRSNSPDRPDHMGWLQMPTSAGGRMIHGIRQAARQICDSSEILLICGSGGAFHGVKGAIEAYCGKHHNLLRAPKIFFVGDCLCANAWNELLRLLQDSSYSLLIFSADGQDLGVNVMVRSLRWMMERKYGAEAKNRIFVATPVGAPLHTMAQEEGYALFPMPKEPGGTGSTLTSAALLAMAAAGIDPLAVLEGAVEYHNALDIRSFENPAWLYAAARYVLRQKGRSRELLCLTSSHQMALGSWYQRLTLRQKDLIGCQPVLLPGDLEALDTMAADHLFETLLRVTPSGVKRPVEMDWKDYDGLGYLAGKAVEDVHEQLLQAMVQTHNDRGIPIITIEAGELTAEQLGGLLYFFELSSALTCRMCGHDPFAPAAERTATAAAGMMQM